MDLSQEQIESAAQRVQRYLIMLKDWDGRPLHEVLREDWAQNYALYVLLARVVAIDLGHNPPDRPVHIPGQFRMTEFWREHAEV